MSTGETQVVLNTNLQKQDLSNLDVSNLTPLSPEVISRQATINIGTIGHVAHGKSTVVKAISGVQTVRFKNELERNITIKLERLSKERLESLLSSPSLRRAYEKRVETAIQSIAEQRRNSKIKRRRLRTHSQSSSHLMPPSSSSSSLHSMRLTEALLKRNSNSCDSLIARGGGGTPSNLRNMASSPSSGYETLTDNASVCSRASSIDNITTPKESSKVTKTIRKRTKSLTGTQRSTLHTPNTPNSPKMTKDNNIKRRLSLSGTKEQQKSSDGRQRQDGGKTAAHSAAPPPKQRKRNGDGTAVEYIVERVECIESINGNAVFFVKWLGYPVEENTWESFENLRECAALETFIEDQSEFFGVTIAAINAELEAEIDRGGLTYPNADEISMAFLDAFEPLQLKIDLLLLAQFRDARSRMMREPEKIRKRVIDVMLLKPYYYMRERQKMELIAWQKRVNEIEYGAPIKIENQVDLDLPDLNFSYILESFAGKDVAIATNQDPPIGCKCTDAVCLPSTKCCARMADAYFAYDKNNRLRIRTGEAIYECNSACNCDSTCRNRLIQHGRKTNLCIFKTSNGCGWGVRTETALRKGEYVCEYVGEIITTDEANERGKRYDDIGRTYLFDLDYNTNAESVYTIDAALYGNVSHFINHSCDPNLAVFPFWINNLDVNMPRLAFFTIRPIKAGEELNFDYIRPSASGGDDDDDDINIYKNLSTAKKVTCRCGAANCRKVLF